MGTQWLSVWFWPAIGLAFVAGVQITRWWLKRQGSSNEKVSREYFKGLNFLLNEEPDKAIEVFIKALEVDSETVELHLALGGLFRRKGQVDRATRIHQNLIARPSLTAEQRLLAIYELAQDYYKAGLLDRAENLFTELKDSQSYRELALQGLCEIYQQEKEWSRAIEVARQRKRASRGGDQNRIAHYWCELAELAIAESRFDEARKCLRNALSENRASARAVLLRGELHFKQGEYRRAVDLWQSLAVSHPTLASLVVGRVIAGFKALQDDTGLRNYLQELAVIPREAPAFAAWLQALETNFGTPTAQSMLFERARQEGLSGPVAQHLYDLSNSSELAPNSLASGLHQELLVLVQDLLARAKLRRIEYTCQRCGFDTKSHYWLCPNCGEWDSFSI